MAAGLACRILLVLALTIWGSAAAYRAVPEGHYLYHNVPRVGSWFGDLFVKWDSYWYLNIVEHSYHHQSGVESNTAFLPAYPYAIKAISSLAVPPAAAGVAISSICLLVLLAGAFWYARPIYGQAAAEGLVIFLCVFPSSWVFQMVYTESLFCAALFGFLVLYQRGWYRTAGLVGFLLPLTRAAGLCVLVAVVADWALQWWRGRRLACKAGPPVTPPRGRHVRDARSPKSPLAKGEKVDRAQGAGVARERAFPWERVPAGIGVLAGVLAVGAFYWRISGHPFGYMLASRSWSTLAGQGYFLPLVGSLARNLGQAEAQVYLLFLIVYVVGTIWLLRLRQDMSSFFCAAYGLFILQGSHVSQMRYLLPLLPVHALLVDRLGRKRWLIFLLLAVLQVILTRKYLDWQIII